MDELFEYMENKQQNAQNILNLTIRDEDGATMAEYALMAALIAAVAAVTVSLLGTSVNSLFGNAATKFP